jgi:two-component system sensor histidine kinase CssS
MHLYLTEQEEYKNQMYQNISHDFKTPITVMKSYIEATEDGIQTKDETLKVIKEQLKKLEFKVHSLLYLNKLNYLKDDLNNSKEQYDVSIIINASVQKFKISRPDVEFVLDIDKKSIMFRGSADMWEAIVDNILNNFTRYAKKKIKITVKNNKIILYNDGETIDENLLNNIFTPYEKGVKGVFGLGLSIVKKTLHLLNYDISIENVKNGVKFTIY